MRIIRCRRALGVDPLTPSGENTYLFSVPDEVTWPLEPGVQMKRKAIHQLTVDGRPLGGREQHGIVSCLGGAELLIFMGERGENNGYGKHDKHAGLEVTYTGEGRFGNQDPTSSGNRALLEADESTIIHFFRRERKRDPYTYVGRVTPLSTPETGHWRWDRAPDRNDDERDVLVFSLRVRNAPGRAAVPAAVGRDPQPVATRRRWSAPSQGDVEIAPSAGGSASRVEHGLQAEFGAWLESRGHEVWSETIEGQIPDFIDGTDGLVIEAKPSAARPFVRLAIGQVLDYADAYRRAGTSLRPAVLFPSRPEEPRVALARQLGIVVIYKNGMGGFDYDWPDESGRLR